MKNDLECLAWYAKEAPEKLENLLKKEKGAFPTAVVEKLQAFFCELVDADFENFSNTFQMPLHRIEQLADQVGLEPEYRNLPSAICARLVEEREAYRQSVKAQFPDSVVIDRLTSAGSIPIDRVFLLKGVIYAWTNEGVLRAVSFRDNRLSAACHYFLTERRAGYESTSELREIASIQGWPYSEKLSE